MPTYTKVFWAVYDYVAKADLSKAFLNPKGKLGVTIHFLRDNQARIVQKAVKNKAMYDVSFHIEALLS